MNAEDLLRDLDPTQRDAVTCDNPLLGILAGAGSGKTRALTRRVAYRAATEAIDPRHTLVLTFTRKAAGELRHRLHALGLREGVAAGTFHSVAYGQLRSRWADRGVRPPALLDRRFGMFARLLPRLERPELLDALAELDWARARLVEPADYPQAAVAADRVPPIPPEQLAGAMTAFADEKKKRRVVDFDDLLALATRDLLGDPEYAAAQRWRFRHLFVDEFQDVNPLQHRLLEAWRGDRPELCVVGDPDQAIYAWNGADAGFLRNFGRLHPGAAIVRLDQNYRSTPQILGVARRLMSRRRAPAPDLRPNQPDGPAPTVVGHADDQAEAAAIARAVRDGRAPGTPWSAQAVLVRTNAQTALLEEAFRAAAIPYRVRGGQAFLAHPSVSAEVARLHRSHRSLHDELVDLASSVDAEPTGRGEAADAAQHVAALVRLGHEHLDVAPGATAAEFADWLESSVGRDEVETGVDAVDLATFHAAKGLEWPTVHLAGVEQGFVPIGHAEQPAELAEERRLFYVAITRARHQLTIHWAAQRTFGDRARNRNPSIYLDAVTPSDRRAPRSAMPGKVAAQRKKLADRTAADPALTDVDTSDPLFVSLREWRTAAARAADVPAFVVFHDATLAAVAESRPASRDDLLGLPGIGPVKVSRYGDTLLRLVAEHD